MKNTPRTLGVKPMLGEPSMKNLLFTLRSTVVHPLLYMVLWIISLISK
jgi:hypothetical protein